MCNNGHGLRQLRTKYIVHIMLHKKHDKYDNNGKYRLNTSNNKPTREPGVTLAAAGGEHVVHPVPRDSHSSQSHFRYSRGMKGGRSSRYCTTPTKKLRDFTAPTPMQNSRHHPNPLGYLCDKFCFVRGLHSWASRWRKIKYSITHPAY